MVAAADTRRSRCALRERRSAHRIPVSFARSGTAVSRGTLIGEVAPREPHRMPNDAGRRVRPGTPPAARGSTPRPSALRACAVQKRVHPCVELLLQGLHDCRSSRIRPLTVKGTFPRCRLLGNRLSVPPVRCCPMCPVLYGTPPPMRWRALRAERCVGLFDVLTGSEGSGGGMDAGHALLAVQALHDRRGHATRHLGVRMHERIGHPACTRVELLLRRLHARTLKIPFQGSQPVGNLRLFGNVPGCVRTSQLRRMPPPVACQDAPVGNRGGPQ